MKTANFFCSGLLIVFQSCNYLNPVTEFVYKTIIHLHLQSGFISKQQIQCPCIKKDINT